MWTKGLCVIGAGKIKFQDISSDLWVSIGTTDMLEMTSHAPHDGRQVSSKYYYYYIVAIGVSSCGIGIRNSGEVFYSYARSYILKGSQYSF